MKKITILAALMLLVSVSTVLAVRTHQRNLTQLTAQNIEALTNFEDRMARKEARQELKKQKDIYNGFETYVLPCKTNSSGGGSFGIDSTKVSGQGGNAYDGNEVFCITKPGSSCLRQYCNLK